MYGGSSYSTITYGGITDLTVPDRPSGDSSYNKPKIIKLKGQTAPKIFK